MAIGFVFGYVVPGGISNTGANYLSLFLTGVVAGTAFGALVAAFTDPVGAWRHVLLGALGGSASWPGRLGCSSAWRSAAVAWIERVRAG